MRCCCGTCGSPLRGNAIVTKCPRQSLSRSVGSCKGLSTACAAWRAMTGRRHGWLLKRLGNASMARANRRRRTINYPECLTGWPSTVSSERWPRPFSCDTHRFGRRAVKKPKRWTFLRTATSPRNGYRPRPEQCRPGPVHAMSVRVAGSPADRGSHVARPADADPAVPGDLGYRCAARSDRQVRRRSMPAARSWPRPTVRGAGAHGRR